MSRRTWRRRIAVVVASLSAVLGLSLATAPGASAATAIEYGLIAAL
jgi:hypothetical protein